MIIHDAPDDTQLIASREPLQPWPWPWTRAPPSRWATWRCPRVSSAVRACLNVSPGGEPLGGTANAVFLRRTALASEGGAAVGRLLARATALLPLEEREDEDAAAVELAALAHEAVARSWERLHCGSWKDLAAVWREAFGLASLLEVNGDGGCLHRTLIADLVRMNDHCL